LVDLLDYGYVLTEYRGRPRKRKQYPNYHREIVRTMGKELVVTYTPGSIIDVIKTTVINDAFEAFNVWGKRGAGKSTCSLWLMWKAYDYLYNDYYVNTFKRSRVSDDKIWDMVLHHTVFKPSEFWAVLDEYEGGEDHWKRCPGLYIDDAGLHLSKYYWQDKDIKDLMSFLQTIRFKLKLFLFSSPRISDVACGLREGLVTGEIYVRQIRDYRTDPPTIRRGYAYFIQYKDVPDFYKRGKPFTFKHFVHGYGRPFRFPDLPDYIKHEYNKMKARALEDQQIAKRVIEVRKESYLKTLLQCFLPLDREVLLCLKDFDGKVFSASYMREHLAKERNVRVNELKVMYALRSLKAKNLVVLTSEGLWKATREGVSLSQYLNDNPEILEKYG